MLETIFHILGLIAAAGSAVGIIIGAAWGLFMLFGGKWLEARFGRDLEDFRQQGQHQLERLKTDLSILFDRSIKLHQREFEALPEVWGKLIDAYHPALSAISALQSYPNLDIMTAPQLEEFISSVEMADWQKDELRKAERKVNYYSKVRNFQRYSRSRELLRDFDLAILKHGIFIPIPLKESFRLLSDHIFEALTEWERNQELDRGEKRENDNIKRLTAEGPKLFKALEYAIQERLCIPTSGEPSDKITSTQKY